MKRIVIILSIFILLTGCGKLSNTPTKRVEELFDNYKMLSENVVKDLNDTVNKEDTFNESQKELYKDIIKKQYNNLVYEIKDEYINGDNAIVQVQITVKDFNKILKEAELYFNENQDEFEDINGNYLSKYIDYRLEKLKDAKETVTYTLNISLTLKDKKWELNPLSNNDLEKISGIYSY